MPIPARRATITVLGAAAIFLAACAGRTTEGRTGDVASPRPGVSTTSRAEALASLVAAERAFATLARDSNTWHAFVSNMDDESVLFRPDPVPGKRWLLDHPNRDRTSLLAWEPRYADVSASGDFGWTTGPFEFRPNRDSATVAGRGNFLTVWRRTGSGPWKALFDGGNGQGPWTLSPDGWGEWTSAPPAAAGARFADGLSAGASVLAADSAIGSTTRGGAPSDALIARLDDEIRLYRPGRDAIIGREAARAELAGATGTLTSRPIGSAVASSGDLAFTYGDYAHTPAGASAEKGLYVRLWRRGGAGEWRVAFDVLFPQRPPR